MALRGVVKTDLHTDKTLDDRGWAFGGSGVVGLGICGLWPLGSGLCCSFFGLCVADSEASSKYSYS